VRLFVWGRHSHAFIGLWKIPGLTFEVLESWETALKPFKSRESHFSCRVLQSYNSPGDWARELFKPSTDSASLVVEIEKKCFHFIFGGGFSGGNATSGSVFGYLYLALGPNLSVAEIMAKTPKIGENFCTHKPQSRVEYTPFLNGHHSPEDRARELFKSALNGERRVV